MLHLHICNRLHSCEPPALAACHQGCHCCSCRRLHYRSPGCLQLIFQLCNAILSQVLCKTIFSGSGGTHRFANGQCKLHAPHIRE